MCPACLTTTVALTLAGATSAGGLTVLFLKKPRAKRPVRSIDLKDEMKGAPGESSKSRYQR